MLYKSVISIYNVYCIYNTFKTGKQSMYKTYYCLMRLWLFVSSHLSPSGYSPLLPIVFSNLFSSALLSVFFSLVRIKQYLFILNNSC